MCGPALIPLTIAAGVLTAGAQVYSGIAAKQQGKYENQIAQSNAQAERNAAADAQKRGQIAEQQRYRQLAQSMGAQRAAMAANGLDLSFGSAAGTVADTAMIGNEDALTIAQNTTREMQGHDISAVNYTMQGQAAKAKGDAALFSSVLSAGGTLLGTASQVGKMGAPK